MTCNHSSCGDDKIGRHEAANAAETIKLEKVLSIFNHLLFVYNESFSLLSSYFNTELRKLLTLTMREAVIVKSSRDNVEYELLYSRFSSKSGMNYHLPENENTCKGKSKKVRTRNQTCQERQDNVEENFRFKSISFVFREEQV
jgi:hypothetical protein